MLDWCVLAIDGDLASLTSFTTADSIDEEQLVQSLHSHDRSNPTADSIVSELVQSLHSHDRSNPTADSIALTIFSLITSSLSYGGNFSRFMHVDAAHQPINIAATLPSVLVVTTGRTIRRKKLAYLSAVAQDRVIHGECKMEGSGTEIQATVPAQTFMLAQLVRSVVT